MHTRIPSSANHSSQKVERAQTIDEWKHKVWSSHTKDYYSATKRNGALLHATTWTNLENNMLSERSQSKRTTQYMIPLPWAHLRRQKVDEWLRGARGGEWEQLLNGYRFFFWGVMEMFWK